MRCFSIILFTFFAACVSAQQGAPATTNTIRHSSETINEEIPVAPKSDKDTMHLEEIMIKSESTSKKQKQIVKSEAETPVNRSVQEEAATGAQMELKVSAVQSFSAVKVQSSKNRIQRTPSAAQQLQMDESVRQLELVAPESFEYNLFRYQAGNHNVTLVENLNKAEQLKPGHPDVLNQKAAFNWIVSDTVAGLEYLQKMIQSKQLPEETVQYASDLLLSVPDNGTLITHGFEDSFGAFYQQNSNAMREDVTIVSLELLQSKQMRNSLETKGFNLPKKEQIDVNYLSEFCSLNSERSLALSMTIPKEYLTGISKKLFVSGLVFEYRNDSDFNNFLRNDELWNRLNKYLIQTMNSEKARQLAANYLPMLMQLSRVYGELNEPKKKQDIDAVIDKIARESRKTEQVKKLQSN